MSPRLLIHGLQKPGTQFEMQVEHAEYRIYEPVGGREGCRRTYKTRSSLSNCCQRVRGHFFRRLESFQDAVYDLLINIRKN